MIEKFNSDERKTTISFSVDFGKPEKNRKKLNQFKRYLRDYDDCWKLPDHQLRNQDNTKTILGNQSTEPIVQKIEKIYAKYRTINSTVIKECLFKSADKMVAQDTQLSYCRKIIKEQIANRSMKQEDYNFLIETPSKSLTKIIRTGLLGEYIDLPKEKQDE